MKRPNKNVISHPQDLLRHFFARSDYLDYMVLRPLSHITMNWEARWDGETYSPEASSFAGDLNEIIEQIAISERPARYHDNEDSLAERVIAELHWPIQKKGGLWEGADYQSILEQGAFGDLGQRTLATAAAGRVHMALDFGQTHFDEMDDGHMAMLAGLMTIMIYHRYCDGSSVMLPEADDASC
ncbi:hypothetical protein [Mesorhizobium sp. 131-2-5]|uniref:hypothetical protein n=1 Tax=Mesorhizobium sp. 131-2-5 TaxID=2744519 RepID=UPI001929205E|nr:hypothetical protein [Mesorhizobium sp. 131-2-5]